VKHQSTRGLNPKTNITIEENNFTVNSASFKLYISTVNHNFKFHLIFKVFLSSSQMLSIDL